MFFTFPVHGPPRAGMDEILQAVKEWLTLVFGELPAGHSGSSA
jgi:hypothetical protein